MFEENIAAYEPRIKFVNPATYRPSWTDEEIAASHARIDQFYEAMKQLDETEPLPDNFDDLCRGKAITPVYSKRIAT